MAATVKAATLLRARAIREFDELSYDVVHNQILKGTIRTLLAVQDLDDHVHAELLEVYRRMPEVTPIRVTHRHFCLVQLHRNNRFYHFLLTVCRFVHEQLLINEDGGGAEFRDFVRDERAMRRLFERFVRNFYRRHAEGYRVKVERFRWQRTAGAGTIGSTENLLRTGASAGIISRKEDCDCPRGQCSPGNPDEFYMRALSIRRPHAELILRGIKTVE